MNGTDGMGKKLQAAKKSLLEKARSDLDDLLCRLDSPVEQLFALALLRYGWVEDKCFWRKGWSGLELSSLSAGEKRVGRGRTVWTSLSCAGDEPREVVGMQVPLLIRGQLLRLDFARWSGADSSVRLAIELDGHEFHEKTKERRLKKRSLVSGLLPLTGGT